MIVIVSKKKGVFINRAKTTDENSLTLSNDHILMNHEIHLDKVEIDEVWLVKAILAYDITSNSKLKYLNDNFMIMDKVLSIIK